jgi:hypothetical protein
MTSPKHAACIVVPHRGGGLFSLFNKVITCMEIYPRIRVDYLPRQTPYKRVAEKNLWETICHPLRNAPVDGEPCDLVESYPHHRYTGRTAGRLYGLDESWRSRLHPHFKGIEVKGEVFEIARSISAGVLLECITILHRTEPALAREQLNGVLPTVDELCQAANAVSAHRPVFVCADSHEGTAAFRQRLGTRVVVWDAADRTERSGKALQHTGTCGSDHVRRMFALTLAISRTAHLVHPTSNIATAALYMNPKLAHTFVQAGHPPALSSGGPVR